MFILVELRHVVLTRAVVLSQVSLGLRQTKRGRPDCKKGFPGCTRASQLIHFFVSRLVHTQAFGADDRCRVRETCKRDEKRDK